jgi:glycosyltransferase involved in cell wall biosynthesis
MKIALISPAHPLRGGIAALSERLAHELQQQGHEVLVYSFSLQYPSILFPGKTQLTDDPAPEGLKIIASINSINPFSWWKTGRAIARFQPDRVIVRYWLPFMGPALGTIIRVMRLFSRKPIVTTGLIDNIIPHEKRPGDRLFSRYFASVCSDFLTMSTSVQEELKGFSSMPARFAPHPIYDQYGEIMPKKDARELLGIPTQAKLALFFGFIRPYKGLDLLLKAMPQSPDLHLIIAGECYEDWTPYQEIIDQHQLKDRIWLFTDFIPAGEVRLFFSAADIVVQPYKSATQSGISQIAYHFECPMLVTNVGGLPEIVQHGKSGYVLSPDPDEIAVALIDFFENNRMEAMQSSVRTEKKRFSWIYFVEKLLKNGTD